MCVYETSLLLLFAYITVYRTSAASVELALGVGAPSLSLVGFMIEAV